MATLTCRQLVKTYKGGQRAGDQEGAQGSLRADAIDIGADAQRADRPAQEREERLQPGECARIPAMDLHQRDREGDLEQREAEIDGKAHRQ